MIDLFKKIMERYSLVEIAKELNLSTSTLKRWIETEKIPENYLFELLELNETEIDYSRFSSKHKDQFFTPVETARYCFKVFTEIFHKYERKNSISEFVFIEPSAGDGSFLKILPDGTIAMDIEPKHPLVQKRNYLKWNPDDSSLKYIVFGNPPFGLRGHLALKFINHSYSFADYVCFILPQLFESDGKGVPRKRVCGFNLIHSQRLDTDFYEPNGSNTVKINTIFQVWSKYHSNPEYVLSLNPTSSGIKIYSISDGGTSSSTRNKHMINNCDIYLPSTCFGKENMKVYFNFEELPNRRGYGLVFDKLKKQMIKKALDVKWEEVSFLSTNSALNLRSSNIQKNLEY